MHVTDDARDFVAFLSDREGKCCVLFIIATVVVTKVLHVTDDDKLNQRLSEGRKKEDKEKKVTLLCFQ